MTGTIEGAATSTVRAPDLTGQATAFQRLAAEHLDAAYRLARAILHDPTEAQDATHDAFVQAWRKWPSLRDPSRFESWFQRILVNTCRNGLTRRARLRVVDISEEVGALGGDPADRALDRIIVRRGLESLSPDHRIVLALRFYLDLSVEDIATRLRLPVGTVHSRLHYSLKRLGAAIGSDEARGPDR